MKERDSESCIIDQIDTVRTTITKSGDTNSPTSTGA